MEYSTKFMQIEIESPSSEKRFSEINNTLLKMKKLRDESPSNKNLTISENTMRKIENEMDTNVSCFDPDLKKKIIINAKLRKPLNKENENLFSSLDALLKNFDKKFEFLEEKINQQEEKINQQEEKINQQKEINEKLIKDNKKLIQDNELLMAEYADLAKRKNLEYFLRAYFRIPFSQIIRNISSLLRVMFDDIKENFRENKSNLKVAENKLIIRNYFAVVFSGESYMRRLSLEDLKGKNFTIGKEIFLGNVANIRNIVFSLIKLHSKSQTTEFYLGNMYNQNTFCKEVFEILDESKDLFSELSFGVHKKIITPMKDLNFPEKIPNEFYPFKVLTEFYFDKQDDINNELCAKEGEDLSALSLVESKGSFIKFENMEDFDEFKKLFA